jgi:hypothetical protein
LRGESAGAGADDARRHEDRIDAPEIEGNVEALFPLVAGEPHGDVADEPDDFEPRLIPARSHAAANGILAAEHALHEQLIHHSHPWWACVVAR